LTALRLREGTLERSHFDLACASLARTALPSNNRIGYGVDSDFVRVRVRGLPPTADELQFIDRERIKEAQEREPESLLDDPLICGVDVSAGGAAWNVAAVRRGGDARSIRGSASRVSTRAIAVCWWARLAEILRDTRPARKVTAMFIDMAFGRQIYEHLRALGFNNVFEVNFGLTHTPDRTKANMRAYMWGRMKDWLLTGAIETDEKIATDLAGPGYHINRSNLLVLESKADMQERGQASPDDGDALALTFAQDVAPAELKERERDEDDEFGGQPGLSNLSIIQRLLVLLVAGYRILLPSGDRLSRTPGLL
jgi:hypothetical protein